MLLGLDRVTMAGGGLSAKSYVQDGLVGMWDGIEHGSGTTWQDWTGNSPDWTMTGFTFDSAGLVLTGTESQTDVGSLSSSVVSSVISRANNGDNNTLEVCVTIDEIETSSSGAVSRIVFSNSLVLSNRVAVCFGVDNVNKFIRGGVVASWNSAISNKSRTGSYTSASVNNLSSGVGYYNGCFAMNENISGYNVSTDRKIYFLPAISSSWNAKIHGHIHCIRLYAAELTAAQIAANYAVDQKRFGLT